MSVPDLSTSLAGMRLPTPVMTAAGCAVSGRELEPFLDMADLGAVVTRSITLDPRAGSPMPRIRETPSGVLAAGGLQNPGLQGFLATELPWLAQRQARTVVSIAGGTVGEYAELARRLGDSPGVSAIEVNLGCAVEDRPGREFGGDAYQAAKLLTAVRRETPPGVPVLAKLSADANLVDVARAVVTAGADGLVLVNGLPGLAIDPETLRPALGAGPGRLSGPAVHAVAVHCVWRVRAALPDVPIVGVGGVRTGFDALELLLAGAVAVQVGTAILGDPSAPARIVQELAAELTARGAHGVLALVGIAHHENQELR